MVHNILGCVLILRNQLLPNSGPPPLPCVIKIIITLTPLSPHLNDYNMCAETKTIDVDNVTKNYKKILDIGPYNVSGVGYD